MAPILYHQDLCPPSRAVRIVAAALNIPLEERVIKVLEKEQLKPEFLKLNPQHTIPCLDDDGFILWDSHVIIEYLIHKYGKDTPLYPKDLKMRAKIEQRNHYDNGVLFAKMRELLSRLAYKGAKGLNPVTMEDIADSYKVIEAFLEDNKYLCGNDITIADISCATTIQALEVAVPISKELKKTISWLDRVNKYPPYAEVNTPGLKHLQAVIKKLIQQ